MSVNPDKNQDLFLILKRKNEEIRELRKELDEYRGFQKGLIWKILMFYRALRKAPRRFLKTLKEEGFRITVKKIIARIRHPRRGVYPIADKFNEEYALWLRNNQNRIIFKGYAKKVNQFRYNPIISIIVPVYNVDENHLKEALESVFSQIYTNWELCIADDASTRPYIRKVLEEYKNKDRRVKVVYRKKNGHISAASNSALKLATGEFVTFLDNDDIMRPHALYKVIEALNEEKNLDFIYSDEDKLEPDGTRTYPHFKTDWNPYYFLATNYLCHLSVVRRKLVERVGGFRVGYEGSQDYDLFLRVTDLTDNIYHIPDILYSWRKIPGSTAVTNDQKCYADSAGFKALKDTLKRRKIEGSVDYSYIPGVYKINYKVVNHRLVSIIIPSKDKKDHLERCIESILSKTSYKNYEIVVVDTGSKEVQTLEYFNSIERFKNIKTIKWLRKFNFSKVNNFGVKNSKGDYFLFLNNDTEVINDDWLTNMIEIAQDERVGAVGAKLLYPNNLIQHAGIILGLGEDMIAGHIYINYDDIPSYGPPIRKDSITNYSAVTAACILSRRRYFNEVGGFTSDLALYYNDVDYCLKLREKGLLIVYTPYAKLYHYESVTIKDNEKVINPKEVSYMRRKWGNLLLNDPYLNPNLAPDNSGYKISSM